MEPNDVDLEQSIRSEFTGGESVESPEAVQARLELERGRLELERDRLLLERQRLELERRAGTASGAKRPASQRSRAIRPPSGRHEAMKARRPPSRRPSSIAPLFAMFAVVAAGVGGLAVLMLTRTPPPPVANPTSVVGESPERAALRAKAEAGDGEACLNLGLFLWNGVGGPRSPADAISWLQRAADLGDARTSAQAVLVLEEVRTLERNRQQLKVYLAELEERKTREEQRRRERERAEALERARLEAEERAAEERRAAEEQAKRLAGLKDEGRRLRIDIAAATPAEFSRMLKRAAELGADPLADDELRGLVEAVRKAADTFRLNCADRGVSQARRYADEGRLAEALAALDEVESLGVQLTEAVQAERARWRKGVAERAEAARLAEEARRKEAAAAAEAEAQRLGRLEDLKRAAANAALAWYQARDVSRSTCQTCRGSLKIKDYACAGTGRVECKSCHGLRLKRCRQCNGSGVINVIIAGIGGGMSTRSCETCNGTGTVGCRKCRATGNVPCPTRGCSRGELTCPDCLEGIPHDLLQDLVEPIRPAMRPDEVIKHLRANDLVDLIGRTLFVSSAEIQGAESEPDGETIKVTALVRWYDAEEWTPSVHETVHETRWRRDGQRLVLLGSK